MTDYFTRNPQNPPKPNTYTPVQNSQGYATARMLGKSDQLKFSFLYWLLTKIGQESGVFNHYPLKGLEL